MTAKESLTTACYFLNICKQMFEGCLLDEKFSRKQLIKSYIGKLEFIEKDIYCRISDEENRAYFRKQITANESDTLLFGNIVLVALEMDQQKRETLERLIEAIKKGEAVEITN